jgi:tetratricopeptide (TPR) repeat protein
VTLLWQVALIVAVPALTIPILFTVHELGHAALAGMARVPVVQIRLGPVAWTRTSGGRRWQAVGFKDFGRPAWVNVDLTGVPTCELRARLVLCRAGGPAGSLIVGATCVAVALHGGGLPFWISAGVVAIMALDVLPVDWKLDPLLWNDGYAIRKLLQSPAEAINTTMANTLANALHTPQRPRDWDPRLVELAARSGEQPTSAGQVLGRAMGFYHLLDRGEVEHARHLLQPAYEARDLLFEGLLSRSSYRPHIVGWTAFGAVRVGHDGEEAGRILSAEADWSGAEHVRDLATAAGCLAAGHAVNALVLCDWLLLRWPIPGDGYQAMVREQVEAVRTEAAAAASGVAGPDEVVAKPLDEAYVDKAAAVAEAQVQRARGLDETAQAGERLAICDEVEHRFGDNPDPRLRDAVAECLSIRAETLRRHERWEEAMAAYGKVIRLPDDEMTPVLEVLVADALVKRGKILDLMRRWEEALASYDEAVCRLVDADNPKLIQWLAVAINSKIQDLLRLKRHEEAATASETVVGQFGASSDPFLRSQVVTALVSRGWGLAHSGQLEAALAAYDEAVRRFDADPQPASREAGAKALMNKTYVLRDLGRIDEMIAICDDFLRRFDADGQPLLRENVAEVLFNKGWGLAATEQPARALQVYDETLRRFGQDDGPFIRNQVAWALHEKAAVLRTLGRPSDAVAAANELARRFRDSRDPEIERLVRDALADRDRSLRGRGGGGGHGRPHQRARQ